MEGVQKQQGRVFHCKRERSKLCWDFSIRFQNSYLILVHNYLDNLECYGLLVTCQLRALGLAAWKIL